MLNYAVVYRSLVAEGQHVLTYDLWGHGHSAAPDTRYDAALYTGQLRELLSVLQLDS